MPLVATCNLLHLPMMVNFSFRTGLIITVAGLYGFFASLQMFVLVRHVVAYIVKPAIGIADWKLESDSTLLLEGVEVIGLTSYAHELTVQPVFLLDVDEVERF